MEQLLREMQTPESGIGTVAGIVCRNILCILQRKGVGRRRKCRQINRI